jgi:hypothetical protein
VHQKSSAGLHIEYKFINQSKQRIENLWPSENTCTKNMGTGSFRPESRSPPEAFRPYSRSPRVCTNFKSGYLTCNCFKKVCQFAPLNRYYIIIDEVFFDNCLVIIYLLIVCKKTNNSFILVYFNYLFITSCIQRLHLL